MPEQPSFLLMLGLGIKNGMISLKEKKNRLYQQTTKVKGKVTSPVTHWKSVYKSKSLE